ncbi:MAG: DUF4118 domain-containing protein [Candidatus Xenobia bacterium]
MRARVWSGYLMATVGVTAFSALLSATHGFSGQLALGYVLCTALAAALGGSRAGLLSVLVGLLWWDFLFLPPRYTLQLARLEDGMLLGEYLIVSSCICLLVTRRRNVVHAVPPPRRRAGSSQPDVDLAPLVSPRIQIAEPLPPLPVSAWLRPEMAGQTLWLVMLVCGTVIWILLWER